MFRNEQGLSEPGDEDDTRARRARASRVPADGRIVGRRLRVVLRALPVVKVVVVAVVAWALFRLLGHVDWLEVWASLSQLAWWQAAVLVGVVLLRQALNAGTLALFVPGLGLPRAVMNDVTAGLLSLLAPPPADLVMRMRMLQSWGMPMTGGTAALVLNSLTYYVARFGAPILGFLVALSVEGFNSGYAWTALGSGVIALALVIALVAMTRGERAAAGVGRRAGRLAQRVVPARADPDRWSATLVNLQASAGDQLRRSGRWAALDLLGLLLAESVLLVLCLRFAGVSPAEATAASVISVLLVSYPLTALPFFGLGVLDTAVIAVLASEDGVDTTTAVAGVIIWRVCVLLVPLLMGLLCLLAWPRRDARPRAGRG